MNWDQISWLWDWTPLLWDGLRRFWDDIVQSDNAATVILGLVGLALLWWRSKSSERQATAAQEQVSLAQLESLYARYQKGADMLGDANMSTRLGGIYSLRRLAEKHPDELHLPVMELLCAFIRKPPFLDRAPTPRPREDVQSALDAVIKRSDRGIDIEKTTKVEDDLQLGHFRIDLMGAYLEGAYLPGAKLHGASLDGVNLAGAYGRGADLTYTTWTGAYLYKANFDESHFDNAKMIRITDMSNSTFQQARFKGTHLGRRLVESRFHHANMTKAVFGTADLTDAELEGADLSGAVFTRDPEIGENTSPPKYSQVTQRQLDTAIANPEFPPDIPEGLTDIETGKPMVWNRKLCGDRWIERQKSLNPEQNATGIGPKGLRALWPSRHWFAR